MKQTPKPRIGIIMGSDSDLDTMQGALDVLTRDPITPSDDGTRDRGKNRIDANGVPDETPGCQTGSSNGTGAFIVPGLTRKEKRITVAFIGAAVPLFLGGCWLAYAVLPRAMGALLSFTPTSGSNIIDVSLYLSFVLKFILVFGLGFLLPVFLVGLNVAHILSGRLMLRAWRGAVFLCFLFTAMMTPDPNPFTMIILAIPLAALYFAAVGVSLLLAKRRSTQDPSAAWQQVAHHQGRVGRQGELAHGDGDARDAEVSVHHEHEVDHSRDVELRGLGVEPTSDQLVGARFTKAERG